MRKIYSNVGLTELKTYITRQLNLKDPLTELSAPLLARVVHKIIVKADGRLYSKNKVV